MVQFVKIALLALSGAVGLVSAQLNAASVDPNPAAGLDKQGDLTYFTPGLGSCGTTNTDNDPIVAAAAAMFTKVGGKANLCNKKIKIHWKGITQTATITDTCPPCTLYSLDASTSLFKSFASTDVGRLHNMTWEFV